MIDWTCSERRIDALAGHSETALRQLKPIRRAPSLVQDPDAVTKDDGLAPDLILGRRVSGKVALRQQDKTKAGGQETLEEFS